MPTAALWGRSPRSPSTSRSQVVRPRPVHVPCPTRYCSEKVDADPILHLGQDQRHRMHIGKPQQEGKQSKDVCESEPARHRGTPHKVDGKTTPTSAYVNRAIVCSKRGPTKGRSLPSAARSAVFPDRFFGCATFPQTFELTHDCVWAKVCRGGFFRPEVLVLYLRRPSRSPRFHDLS